MSFIVPMYRNKPYITYLFHLAHHIYINIITDVFERIFHIIWDIKTKAIQTLLTTRCIKFIVVANPQHGHDKSVTLLRWENGLLSPIKRQKYVSWLPHHNNFLDTPLCIIHRITSAKHIWNHPVANLIGISWQSVWKIKSYGTNG